MSKKIRNIAIDIVQYMLNKIVFVANRAFRTFRLISIDLLPRMTWSQDHQTTEKVEEGRRGLKPATTVVIRHCRRISAQIFQLELILGPNKNSITLDLSTVPKSNISYLWALSIVYLTV